MSCCPAVVVKLSNNRAGSEFLLLKVCILKANNNRASQSVWQIVQPSRQTEQWWLSRLIDKYSIIIIYYYYWSNYCYIFTFFNYYDCIVSLFQCKPNKTIRNSISDLIDGRWRNICWNANSMEHNTNQFSKISNFKKINCFIINLVEINYQVSQKISCFLGFIFRI